MTIIEQIIEIIKRNPGLTSREISGRTSIPTQQIRNGLTNLVKSKRAYKITTSGKAHWYYGTIEKPMPATAQPDRINKMTGSYLCPELRVTPYRPGAMDAFNLPSRGL